MSFLGILKRNFSVNAHVEHTMKDTIVKPRQFPLGVVPNDPLYLEKLKFAGQLARDDPLPWMATARARLGSKIAYGFVAVTGISCFYFMYQMIYENDKLTKTVKSWKGQ